MFGARVAQIDGGGLRNAIPRESSAVVAVPKKLGDGFVAWVESEFAVIRTEYETTDPNAEIAVVEVVPPERVLPEDLQKSLLAGIYAATCGIHRMCPDIEGLVQTSNNVALAVAQHSTSPPKKVGKALPKFCCKVVHWLMPLVTGTNP